jgi:short-subunit dehydrogenase
VDKRNVLITGAGSGLGKAMAEKYSSMGFTVFLIGRTKEKLLNVGQFLEGEFDVFEADIRKLGSIREIVDEIIAKYGAIDVLINNAGVGYFDNLESLEEKWIHEMIDINLKGTIFFTQAVLPYMRERNTGKIINIISLSGKRGLPDETVYSASKFGVKGFAESLKQELKGTDIRIFNAYMGNMQSGLWDQQINQDTFIDPADVAEIIFSLNEEKRNMNVPEVDIENWVK